MCIFLCRIARYCLRCINRPQKHTFFFSEGIRRQKIWGTQCLPPKEPLVTCDELWAFYTQCVAPMKRSLVSRSMSLWCDSKSFNGKIPKTDDAFIDESLQFSEFSYGYDNNQMCGCLFLLENVIDCSICLICSPRRVDKNLRFCFETSKMWI